MTIPQYKNTKYSKVGQVCVSCEYWNSSYRRACYHCKADLPEMELSH